MKLISEQDVKRLLAAISLVTVSTARIPAAPPSLSIALKKLQTTWGYVPAANDRFRQDTWHKFSRLRDRMVFEPVEGKVLPELLFIGAGEDCPPLYSDAVLFEHALKELARLHDPASSQRLVKYFFNAWPCRWDFCQSYIKSLKYFIRTSKTLFPGPLSSLLRKLLDVGFPTKIVETSEAEEGSPPVGSLEPLAVAVHKQCTDFIDYQSGFVNEAWRARFSFYSKKLESSYQNPDLFNAVLLLIERDSEINGRLRNAAAAPDFALAVALPFLTLGIQTPKSAAKKVLALLERFLGSFRAYLEHESENALWCGVDPEVIELIKSWLLRKRFEDTFAFISKALPGGVSSRHWMDRRQFWQKYLMAGRIKSIRLYANPAKRSEFRESLFQTYPDTISQMGEIRGRQGTNIMLGFELVGGVVAFEFSDSGSLRIGRPTPKLSTTCRVIEWYDLSLSHFDSIRHTAEWRYRAADVIRRETGLKPPV